MERARAACGRPAAVLFICGYFHAKRFDLLILGEGGSGAARSDAVTDWAIPRAAPRSRASRRGVRGRVRVESSGATPTVRDADPNRVARGQ